MGAIKIESFVLLFYENQRNIGVYFGGCLWCWPGSCDDAHDFGVLYVHLIQFLVWDIKQFKTKLISSAVEGDTTVADTPGLALVAVLEHSWAAMHAITQISVSYTVTSPRPWLHDSPLPSSVGGTRRLRDVVFAIPGGVGM